ncbi:hypothetical protein DICVIV_04513 [Dictyocaulus viviparus]|uniref:CX domain-containing protein n=1 Tax=Dictyocaulus viviparus TaxID=29172 RepID=A0A0D8XXJ6_DICVI|nr:hypothetical protein DICVIV_04513 [Dictyocaulus viviparus]
MKILLLITVINGAVFENDLICTERFPIVESVDIVKKLITKYAVSVIRNDEDGVKWLNYLFVRNDGFQIDGTTYFLNDNNLPPEMTFYFDSSLQLNSVPIFVVDDEHLRTWRPDYPDMTYALTKISHRCDYGRVACGLRCCHGDTVAVQKVW